MKASSVNGSRAAELSHFEIGTLESWRNAGEKRGGGGGWCVEKEQRVKTRHMGGSEGEKEELGWERGYS